MAAPSTGVIDDFNRANGGLGASWTAPVESGHGTPAVLSNAAVGGTAAIQNGAYLNGATYLAAEARCTWPTPATNLGSVRLYTRVSSPGATVSAYYVNFHGDNAQIYINRLDGGADSGALATINIDPQVGWKMCNVTYTVGGDIVVEAWYDSGLGWTLAGSYTDVGAVAAFPALAAAGFIGFAFFASAANNVTYSIDDFGGGESIPSSVVMLPLGMLGTHRV